MRQNNINHLALAILAVATKGFSVMYLLLLPLFHNQELISAADVGYMGAIFISSLIAGTIFVAKWLHRHDASTLLGLSGVISAVINILLLLSVSAEQYIGLFISFTAMGMLSGIALSAANSVMAQATKRGNRYKAFAKISIMTDLLRLLFPAIIALSLYWGADLVPIATLMVLSVVLIVTAKYIQNRFTEINTVTQDLKLGTLRSNKGFRNVLMIEFLDSLASSQLFVFLPLLFISKGFSIEASLTFQIVIFAGYMAGRWLVGLVATKFTGYLAVGWAEVAMAATIGCLIFASGEPLLYLLTFLLGVFSRGTSPAIKALSFDSLEDKDAQKGAALHVFAGDSGSALGQLVFGIMFAAIGAQAPFMAGLLIALAVAVTCFKQPTNRSNKAQAL